MYTHTEAYKKRGIKVEQNQRALLGEEKMCKSMDEKMAYNIKI